ncbi:MAG: hypothetical protein ACYCVN_07960 [Acidimicrobiales bacterium]
MNRKWIWVIILLIIAGVAAFVAFEYFTVSIHGLPSYIPGRKAALPGHPNRGHYRKRGAGAGLIAFVLLVIAGIWSLRIINQDKARRAPTVASGPTADDLLASSPNPESTTDG